MKGLPKSKFGHVTALLALCLVAVPFWGQAPAPPASATVGTQSSQPPANRPVPQPSQPGTIRVRVNEVSAPVTVRDQNGELVLDLMQGDFHIYDNGIEQKINHWDLGGDPLSIVLVVETSSRIQPLMAAIHQTGIVFTQTVMGETGEAAVIGYNDDVNVLQPFTMNQDVVEHTVNTLQVGTDGARLYDAMNRGVSLLLNRPTTDRRVMLVMAESDDSGSETKMGEVLRDAQLANIGIYTIGLSPIAADLRANKQYMPNEVGPPGTYGIPLAGPVAQTPTNEDREYGQIDFLNLIKLAVEKGENVVHHQALQVVATGTGGVYDKTVKDHTMQKAMDAIGGELHAQYIIGYTPIGKDLLPGFHDIQVTVSEPGLKVRTRPGYYLGSAAPPAGN